MSRSASSRHARAALAALLIALSGCSGRLSGGGGGGGGGEPPLPPPDDAPLSAPGLVSALGATGSVRLDWLLPIAPTEGAPQVVAVFQSSDAGSVYDGAPIATALPGTTLIVIGLPDDVPAYFGLALADPVAGDGLAFSPTGVVLRAVPGMPIYVDPLANAAGADGTSPATAFPSMLQALLVASLEPTGRNVWVAGGNFPPGALPVFPGTRVYGGFASDMTIGTRDPLLHPTVLPGASGNPVVTVQGGGLPVVLDGLVLDAGGSANSGLEVTDTPVECRGLVVKNATSRGIKLNGLETGDPLQALLLRCDSFNNGAEGVSVDGAWDLRVEHCDFDANVQEGLDLEELFAPDGRTTHLAVRHSRFRLNGSDGLDADLAAPLFGGDSGGTFDVRIENCLFEGNGAVGLLLDVDYEQAALWSAEIVVRGVTARGNGAAGVRLDLDATAATIVHRLLSVANQGAGLELTADKGSTPVLATISSSVLMGNGGAGVSALENNITPLLAHTVLAGNVGGGVNSPVTQAVAHSSIAWQQAAPFTGTTNHHGITITDPLAALFALAPVEFGTVTGEDAGGVIVAPGGPLLAGGDLVELSDDGVPRSVVGFANAGVTLDPAPTDLVPPTLITRFAGGLSVDEDWRTLAGSAAEDAGMPTPAGMLVDAGVFDVPFGGLPGVEDPEPTPLFFASDIQPPADTLLAAFDTISIEFTGGLPDPASASAATVRVVLDLGGSVAAIVFVQDGLLIVDAPVGGWTGGSALLEIHEGLVSTTGRPLASPLAIPLELP